jgi:hypothetical protein
MKTFRIVAFCFTILYFGGQWYVDDHLKLHSVYWLCTKLVGLIIIWLFLFYTSLKNEEVSKLSFIFSCCMWTLLLGYFGYDDTVKYNSEAHQERFGREYNARRHSLGIPELPVGWYVESRDKYSVRWKAKDTIGHISKRVTFYVNYAIEFEDDNYNLKPVKGVHRNLSVRTEYNYDNGRDSISYWYQVGSDNHYWDITRQQADSIFAAEKIKKDY